MSGEIDPKAAAINEYGKLIRQHKVGHPVAVTAALRPPRLAMRPERTAPLSFPAVKGGAK